MLDAPIDPLYARVVELLTQCGATVGQPGSLVRAMAPDPAVTLRALEERLAGAGLRPSGVPSYGRETVRLTVLDPIDRVVSITIVADPLRSAART
jgi:hypothetical protein